MRRRLGLAISNFVAHERDVWQSIDWHHQLTSEHFVDEYRQRGPEYHGY
jgi:hypothetical protein